MDVGRFEWARERVHARLHGDLDDCPRCRSVEYERWMQRGARQLGERARRGEFRNAAETSPGEEPDDL
jgi:hypothetical protein